MNSTLLEILQMEGICILNKGQITDYIEVIVVQCFQFERSSDQSLQFLRPTHQYFNYISFSGRFGRIFCLFFMATIQCPHKGSALTASFRVRQPPNAPFVLSCPSAEPHLPCGCHGAVVSSTSMQVPSLCRPTAYSLSMGVSDPLSRRRISGSECWRSAVPAISDS